MTAIEWTDLTWNPIVGCSVVSPGCTNCYAMAMAARLEAMARQPSPVMGESPVRHYLTTTKKVNGNWVWTGNVRQAPTSVLEQPLRRKKPAVWFVNSMGDLFHESIPYSWIDDVFGVMATTLQHTYQILTKRAERMRHYMQTRTMGGTVLPNVWLGVSAERQREWDDRVMELLATPAAVRFVSVEPMLGDIYPGRDLGPGRVDWVICGGESGTNARPMYPDWARSLRDRCLVAKVPFFFKQWGSWSPVQAGSHKQGYDCWIDAQGHRIRKGRDECAVLMRRAGVKSESGRELDGRVWDEMPLRRASVAELL